jgi:putative phage-type endonuclease
MATKDVKENRHLYIGGSDIAKVMGLSRWGTPLSLWAEKTGKIPPKDLSNVEAVELGNDLEDFVANKFSQKTGKAVRRSPKVYQHPQYPYMVAHIDRLVTGTDELLECKTCSFFKKDEWEGEEIPQEYILQVIWYLGITGRKVGYIAVLIGGQSFKYKKIEFDSELFDKMVESAKDFWQHVQDDTPVDIVATDDETLKDLYSNHSEIMIDLIPTDAQTKQACDVLEEKVGYLQEIKMHIKQLQDEQKEIETTVKDIIKDNLGIKTPKYIITWKNQTTTKFDTVKLRQERPETFEDYSYESSYRVMRISKNKEVA